MKIAHIEDIWDAWEKGFYIIIPTNGFVTKAGECVMGRGLALQAKQRFPDMPKMLGSGIKAMGNICFIFTQFRVITFPVKHKWNEVADLALIEKSCQDLIQLSVPIPLPIYVPKVGCGNGKLDWNVVLPILEKYFDDRFVVVV